MPVDRCYRSSDCPSADDFCLSAGDDGTVLGTCTRACGKTTDCLTGERCTELPGLPGFKACLTSTDLGVSVGSAPTAGFCNRAADCRSGLCSQAGSCLADCSRDSHCLGGSKCRGMRSAAGAWVQTCMRDSDAITIIGGAMTYYPDECSLDCSALFCDDTASRCLLPCCNSFQCSAGDACLTLNPVSTVDSAGAGGTPVQAGTLVRGCAAPLIAVGTGAVGSPCSFEENPSRCRSGLCVSTDFGGNEVTPYCSDSCCTDADCGTNFRCVGAWDSASGLAYPVCVRR